jgi:hypothetical protein
MSQSTPPSNEQKLLKNARREGIVIMTAWAIVLCWTVGGSYLLGYDSTRPTNLILGMPDWIFYCIVLPWGCCLLLSFWFCFFYMADDDLGQDRDGGGGHD